jgi:polar amino acid transport system substrate-binding protein
MLPALRFAILLLAVVVLAVANPAGAQQSKPAVTGEDTSEGPRRTVLRFVTEGEFPPFNYYDEDGVLTGFNIDLARALCLETNTTCEFQVRPWDELIPALNRGEADAVIAGHVVSAKLLRQVDFTDSYFHTPGRFAGRRDAEKFEITPEDLDGKRIAVAKSTAHEAYLRGFFRYSAIQVYDDPEQAREAVSAGKADLVFDDGISLAFWVAGTSSRDCCELKGGPFHEPRYFGDGMTIAVRKRDPGLKDVLNRALKRTRANGRYEELVLRYFPHRIY